MSRQLATARFARELTSRRVRRSWRKASRRRLTMEPTPPREAKTLNVKEEGQTMKWHSLYSIPLTVVAIVLSAATLSSAQPAVDAWDEFFTGAARFPLRCSSTAVLDMETGLLWERSPNPAFFNWANADAYCNRLVLCTRRGWRLPTIQELASLGGGS